MPAMASSPIGRQAGRGLLTLANLITAVAPVAADWNDSHVFNQRWPSHARFHGVVTLTMTSTLAGLNLWSLWSGWTDRRTSRLVAAAGGDRVGRSRLRRPPPHTGPRAGSVATPERSSTSYRRSPSSPTREPRPPESARSSNSGTVLTSSKASSPPGTPPSRPTSLQ